MAYEDGYYDDDDEPEVDEDAIVTDEYDDLNEEGISYRVLREVHHQLSKLQYMQTQEAGAMTTTTGGTAIELPLQVTAARTPANVERTRNTVVVIVGVGGTGARLAPMVIKMMRQGEQVILVDPDTVEAKNLSRQHFTEQALGMPKVQAVGLSLASEARRMGVIVHTCHGKFSREVLIEAGVMVTHRIIILGCVDTREARAEIAEEMTPYSSYAWIDAGNERRGGQVLLQLKGWPLWNVQKGGVMLSNITREPRHYGALKANLNTIQEQIPALLEREASAPAEVASPGCAVVIEDQSLAANALAASYQASMLSWLLDEVPFSLAGIYFSTVGGATGIPIRGLVPHAHQGYPVTLTTV